MIEGNVVSVKSKAFAIRIIKMCKYLYDNKHEYVLAKQVLRSGTRFMDVFQVMSKACQRC